MASLAVYPVGNYTFGAKPPKLEKDPTVVQRMERLKEKYAREGLRRSVEAVLVVHEHGHPHVLVLQMGAAYFRLPGGRLRPGEDESEGMLRKLAKLLAPPADNMRPAWRVSEHLGTWWRPNFENAMYPYCPPHVARPKETKRLLLIALPERCYLAVPTNMRLVAVPLFELYDNISRYGPLISSIPALLSRFSLTLAGRPAAALPVAGGPAHGAAAAAAVPVAAKTQQVVQYGQQQQQQQPPSQQQQQDNAAAAAAGITVSFTGGGGGRGGQQQQQQPQVAAVGAPPQGADDLFVDFDE